MNCQAIQNQILTLPDPRELTPALRDHVAMCAGCQAWARQAARLEAILEHLPAPSAPGEKKEAMIGDLMQAEPVIQPMATPATRPGYAVVAARFLRRNATYVGGLAAAVLVAVAVYSFWPTPTVQPDFVQTQKDPLLEKVVAANTALARADSPAERFAALNTMADAFAVETRGMARIAPGSQLNELTSRYEKVVKDGMVRQAQKLPIHMTAAERAKLLEPLANKLEADAAAAEKLAAEAPPDAQPALKRMAETARDGEKTLRVQARGGN
jgi:hypothetical protein